MVWVHVGLLEGHLVVIHHFLIEYLGGVGSVPGMGVRRAVVRGS